MKAVKRLIVLAGFASTSAMASVVNFGVNYDWYQTYSACPSETSTPFISNFQDSTIRSMVNNHLRIMKLNGLNTIDLEVGIGADYGGAEAIYPNIRTESDQLKISHLNSYFSVVNLFAGDVAANGIPSIIFKVGGWNGTGANPVCVGPPNNLTFNQSSVDEGVADGIKVIDSLMTGVVNNTSLNVKIDLGGEIAPSNYEPQCSITGKTQYIERIWSHYADTYPTQIAKASFSAIPLFVTNASDAGNPLRNLINAIAATGRPMPSWFSVHPYDVDSIGYTTTGSTLDKMLGVQEVYSEFGFLSNQATPKETIIGEIHYQDKTSAAEIKDFLTNHGGTNVSLSTIIDWPLKNPISKCTGAVNVNPPFKTVVYGNTINKLLNTQQLASTISVGDNPVIVQPGQATGSTTVSWNTSGYSTVAIEYSLDGGAVSAIGQSAGVGSLPITWIQPGHSYTFFLKPVINGVTDETTLLDSVTVSGVARTQTSKYVPIVPIRLLDTRPGGQIVDPIAFTVVGPIATSQTLDLQILGRDGLPLSGVSAVALNVTVTDSTAPGYLTVWPTGQTRPVASNLNLATGQSISNQVVSKVGADGKVSLFLFAGSGSANIVVDVAGYFPSMSDYFPVTPSRLLDTRAANSTIDGQFSGGGAVGPGGTLNLKVLGRGGVPASGVSAVIVNVTATNPSASSFITVWPSGAARPNASNLNVVAGQTIPNLVIVGLGTYQGTAGYISLYNNYGSTDLIADVVGYLPSTATAAPLVPARLLDTRPNFQTTDGYFAGGGALGSGSTLNLTVTGRGGVPNTGVGTVALNITAVTPTTDGFITAWGTNTTTNNQPPLAMGLNFAAGSVIPSLVITQVGPNGQVSLYNSNGSTHLIADVVAWFPSP